MSLTFSYLFYENNLEITIYQQYGYNTSFAGIDLLVERLRSWLD